jgi:cytochrome c2
MKLTTPLLLGGVSAMLLGAALAYKSISFADRGRIEAETLTGGTVAAGRIALIDYGCTSCHTVAGIAEARGLVGPPLTQLASRVYVAGMLPNTPENLTLWIEHPTQVNPRTAMPDLGVGEARARDIAAYLYTLK